MPIRKKLVNLGCSRGLIIPKEWLNYYEKKSGKPVEAVLLELDKCITVTVEDEEKKE